MSTDTTNIHFNYNNEIAQMLEEQPKIQDDFGKMIFYFNGIPEERLFTNYYNFCMNNLRKLTKVFDINGSNIAFLDDSTINARAGRPNDYSIILINKGILIDLNRLFIVNVFFEQSQINSAYKEIENLVGVTIGELMLQYSTLFTYYHELGHIIQKSELLDSYLSEQVSSMNTSEDDIFRSHILEIDADWFAAHNIAFHLIDIWTKLKEKSPSISINILYELIKISSASIQCYLALGFSSFVHELYFLENTHPHACIRLTVIQGLVNDILKNTLGIETKSLVMETIELSNQILEYKGYIKLMDGWKQKLDPMQDEVLKYASLLISKVSENPSLASNKLTQ